MMEEAHEVEIKLKGEKIIEACKNINKNRVVIEVSNDTIKDFLYIIEKVFSNDNVEVTAKDLSAEEKRSLMNIIRKNLYNRSIFDRKIERLMQTLKVAISIGKEDIIEKKAISTINELIEKNVFEAQKCGVYENMTENPAHLSESSLDSTVFKLAVKTANTAVGATELLQVASKQIDSYVYSRVFKEDKELADLMSIKEHYSDENGLYDLDELYSETLGNGKSLVEHGLQIIYEKANEIKELRKAIEDSNGNPDDIQKIFSANFIDKNDLKILMSLMQHKDKIRKERSIFRSIHRIIAENNMQNTETARLDKTVDEVDFSNHGSVWDIMESIITPVDVQLLAQCSKMRTEIEKSTENYENYDAEIKKWQAEKSNVSGYKTKLNAKKKKKRELKEINESNIKKLEELKAKLEKFGLEKAKFIVSRNEKIYNNISELSPAQKKLLVKRSVEFSSGIEDSEAMSARSIKDVIYDAYLKIKTVLQKMPKEVRVILMIIIGSLSVAGISMLIWRLLLRYTSTSHTLKV